MSGECLSSDELHTLFRNVLTFAGFTFVVGWLFRDWTFRCPHCKHCQKRPQTEVGP